MLYLYFTGISPFPVGKPWHWYEWFKSWAVTKVTKSPFAHVAFGTPEVTCSVTQDGAVFYPADQYAEFVNDLLYVVSLTAENVTNESLTVFEGRRVVSWPAVALGSDSTCVGYARMFMLSHGIECPHVRTPRGLYEHVRGIADRQAARANRGVAQVERGDPCRTDRKHPSTYAVASHCNG